VFNLTLIINWELNFSVVFYGTVGDEFIAAMKGA
jgi:hypothetical protein